MTVLERPREAEREREIEAPEAIFPEARRRGRRRRALFALATLAVLGALAGAIIVAVKTIGADPATVRSRLTAGARTRGAAPAPLVAWGDYFGVLHVGDVATGRQLRIATLPITRSSAGPIAFSRGRLLWVDAGNRVRSAELATGLVRVLAHGNGVTSSPGGARLYVDQGTIDFLELNGRTMRVVRRLAIPAGWTADPWVARAISGGLLLTHTGRAAVLGYWHPGSAVKPLGASISLLGAYAPASERDSLLAWIPRCARYAGFDAHCPLAITNIVSGRTVRISSPSRYSFTGGAFSPDGGQFATFVNVDNPGDPLATPRSELAIVDTRTGVLRLDPNVRLTTTEDAAWAVWLPHGRELLAGAIAATYLVNARTLATRPFYFDGPETRVNSIMSSSDLNFSTIAIPPSALSPKQRLRLARAAKTAG